MDNSITFTIETKNNEEFVNFFKKAHLQHKIAADSIEYQIFLSWLSHLVN